MAINVILLRCDTLVTATWYHSRLFVKLLVHTLSQAGFNARFAFQEKKTLTLLNIRESAHLHHAGHLHEVTVIQALEDYTRTPTLQDVLCGFDGLLLSSASCKVTNSCSILLIKLSGTAVLGHLF